MSFAVGCGISITGAVFQALFRNPLAAPDILGVTAGSCFGAADGHHVLTRRRLVVQGNAFVFGALAVSLAYLLATRSWDRSAAVLVISGIVVSAFFQAGLSILMYIAQSLRPAGADRLLDHGQLPHGLVGQGADDAADRHHRVRPALGLQLAAQRHDPARRGRHVPGDRRLPLAGLLRGDEHPDRGLVGGRGGHHRLDGPDHAPHRALHGGHGPQAADPDRGLSRRDLPAADGHRCPHHAGLGDPHQHHHLDHRGAVSRRT